MLLAVAGFASQAQVRVTDSLLAADRGRLPHHGRRRRHRGDLLRGDPRLDPARHRPGRRPVRQIPHRRDDVRARRRAGGDLRHRRDRCRSSRWRGSRPAPPAAGSFRSRWPMSATSRPSERLQPILARYLSGQIIGQLFGQAAGGVLGDLLGWRNVFFVLVRHVRAGGGRPGRSNSSPIRGPARTAIRPARRRAASSPITRRCCQIRSPASSSSPRSSKARCCGARSPISAPTCARVSA